MIIKKSSAILVLFFFPLFSCTELNLSPPVDKYNILMLLPIGSQSHRNCFIPLAETLADRGHEICILSSLPPISKNPKIKEINHGIKIRDESHSMFELRNGSSGSVAAFKEIFPNVAEKLYDVPEVMELYGIRHKFDLIIVDEMFSEVAYPFLEGKKYVAISPPGIMSPSSAILGNVLNPSYTPSLFTDYPRPYTFLQRLVNFFAHLSFPLFWRHYQIFPSVKEKLSKKFPNLPPLAEIEKGLSLVLANTHFSLDFPMSLLPSQVEVGGMHCRPGKTLPESLQTFIDEAGSKGVIYFSLGSVTQGKTIPEDYKKILLDTFSQLEQRVIWKFEEDIKDLPNNVLINKWLPQQDILAHQNVKLFITHGGYLSMQESVYHGKPLLAIPIGGDQVRTAQRIYSKQFGKFLKWEDLTVELVNSTINEIIGDPKYKNAIKIASVAFRDQQYTPLERAVWWTEYVIRHKGAPQLKSPGADLSWIEYLMIDIIAVIFLSLYILYWITKKAICAVVVFIFGSSKSSNLSQKKKTE